ncbi:MAG: hypothetical protein K6U00_12850, partial [Armatimonadetes bacterium]|nr:hypothetical protein [Armatimonadota bacterium]
MKTLKRYLTTYTVSHGRNGQRVNSGLVRREHVGKPNAAARIVQAMTDRLQTKVEKNRRQPLMRLLARRSMTKRNSLTVLFVKQLRIVDQ